MNTNNALRTIEMIRCASNAATAWRAAQHAVRKAQDEHDAAQVQLNHWNDHIYAMGGTDRASPGHSALLAADHVFQEAEQKVRKAEARLRRASARLQAHRPAFNRYPTHRNRTHVTTLLLDRLADHQVDLARAADLIIIQTSAGKDSIVAMHRTVAAAKAAGCLHKVRAMHCDLGSAEWPGVRELARRQAERYGIPFLVVTPGGGFLGMVENRRQWPDAKRRLCTSTLKRDPTGPVITAWVEELGLNRQAIVVNVMGVRGAESTLRARKPRLALDTRTTSANRLVLTWNIIHELSEQEVWQDIAANGLEYHPIYDTGLPRLSCVYCVLAGPDWLILATRVCFALELPLPETYAALERRIGHSFKQDFTLNAIIAASRMLDALDGPVTWRRGDALRQHLGPAVADRYLATFT
ncbi:phosphoadenosine phosphosulfate reductase family protein [Streptomyces sp. NBC_01433]|uniref:phosphoadenosine phosphosulfate reductase family protein n=1 Tax=Streptomyces sp. NBC_01433 TaxID=2903864 RepID=UPI0022576598|nr:phosphoadenosine phosphosulfate reductase family protein [Streptomyces sp. NBC_01433]MCX4681634.1 phosphoadenosine phosphosulfate reductase family protein [Streptomyces sp. NBC_01433]